MTPQQPQQMRAIVHDEYGSPDVLRISEVDKPRAGDDDVLVRVHAASVNPYDWHMMTGKPYLVRLQNGFRRPKQQSPGVDVSGVVVAVGKDVTGLAIGDEVFGTGHGAYAEFVVASGDRVVPKPENVTFVQAAAVPMAAITALQSLRDKGQIRAGHKVLVNGASGGVGSFAVQIAKSFGAEVTGVCSTRNVDMVRSIGADHVIDYTQQDFTRSDQQYHLILDMVGNHSLRKYRRALTPKGIYVSAGWENKRNWIQPLTRMAKVLFASLIGRQKMVGMLARFNHPDLIILAELLESGA
ncbi:MAG: NAD(P)-dependent alcohol dehydrogenase, partial [Acidimicrobiia bacterium]